MLSLQVCYKHGGSIHPKRGFPGLEAIAHHQLPLAILCIQYVVLLPQPWPQPALPHPLSVSKTIMENPSILITFTTHRPHPNRHLHGNCTAAPMSPIQMHIQLRVATPAAAAALICPRIVLQSCCGYPTESRQLIYHMQVCTSAVMYRR